MRWPKSIVTLQLDLPYALCKRGNLSVAKPATDCGALEPQRQVVVSAARCVFLSLPIQKRTDLERTRGARFLIEKGECGIIMFVKAGLHHLKT